jgi:hypothetical protein
MIHSLRDLKDVDDLRLSSLASHLLDLYEEVEDIKKGLLNDRNTLRKRISQVEELVVELEAKVEGQETKKV